MLRIKNERAISLVAYALGISSLAERHPKLTKLTMFAVCAPGAYFGYTTRHYPVQGNDPVFWISFGCMGSVIILTAMAIQWLWNWYKSYRLLPFDGPDRQLERLDILATERSWFDEVELKH